MLRTAQSLPLQGLLTLGFDAGRFPPTPPACYRASWQLPGPDSHRQATTSFTTTDHLFTMTSRLLVARKREARGSGEGEHAVNQSITAPAGRESVKHPWRVRSAVCDQCVGVSRRAM